MSPGIEPRFLTRATVEAIHEEQIDTYGGLHGVRDENTLESAIAAAQNVYLYGGGDMYEEMCIRDSLCIVRRCHGPDCEGEGRA